MIKATFYHSSSDAPVGFKISGHAGYASNGSDIVCAAVSSAAYMVANTIIEVMKIEACADVKDGIMKITVPEGSAKKAKEILLGFELHINELAQQYPKNVTITTEV